MADHTELIAELPIVEKMTTQERLKHAKKRRMLQLKQYSMKEKDHKRRKTSHPSRKSSKNYKVHFDSNVMLLEAAARTDVEEVQRLLSLGVNPDSTNEDGLTALHQCCIDDSDKMMRLLLEFGANINAEDSEKWTPLHAAATCGHLNLAKFLINKGANLLAVNADGNMPYDICEEEKTLDYIESEMAKRGITQQLIDDTRSSTEMQMLQDLKLHFENGGDLDKTDELGATYLHAASANGYVSVVEFLLDNDANPNVTDDDSWRPIHAACCWGHPDIVEMLAQNGADLNALTKNGETPYDICEDPDLKDRILELKTEMDSKRKTQTQATRLSRSQSQNTRSQSVRRTSLRDKSQLSWKDARDEARMRVEQQDKILSYVGSQKTLDRSDKDHSKPANVVSVEDVSVGVSNGNGSHDKVTSVVTKQPERSNELYINDDTGHIPTKMVAVENNELVTNSNSNAESSLLNQESKEVADNKKSESTSRSDSGGRKRQTATSSASMAQTEKLTNLVNSYNGYGDGDSIPQPSSEPGTMSATAVATSQSDLKLDLTVHVTVNTGPTTQYNSGMGTLSDLKKQRNDKRIRTNSVISTSHQEQQLALDDHNSNGLSAGSINKFATVQCSPSPSATRRFSSPNEVVGAGERQGCCVVM